MRLYVIIMKINDMMKKMIFFDYTLMKVEEGSGGSEDGIMMGGKWGMIGK